MGKTIHHWLKVINSLSINSALWVFRRSFDNFYANKREVPIEQIDAWVKSLNDKGVEWSWTNQKRMAYPHLFFYGMLGDYKIRTLRENKYQRENSEGIKISDLEKDFYKYPPVAEQITEYILSIPFYEGIAYFGELIGAWMLTCPESIIRSNNNVENVGKWQVGKETTDWKVPVSWIEWIDSDNAKQRVRDKELQLLFVLDFLLHFAFDDYDTANTA